MKFFRATYFSPPPEEKLSFHKILIKVNESLKYLIFEDFLLIETSTSNLYCVEVSPKNLLTHNYRILRYLAQQTLKDPEWVNLFFEILQDYGRCRNWEKNVLESFMEKGGNRWHLCLREKD